ncbi:hypothetical protein Amet_1425 [Alkaliphilus metalliredigens QYMF]|uniref:Uncharacterized protein n=1 Tax=Alkaliphilus metalliredigens (strain QYMF) TaxID=293826 RepID=A6TN56_ALKMQ|nr:hypothetical protein [Alkaliphilus metalliredigens]ABR47624.1 hypothetical protein Amet_1425 [Alkaliphilus metalliredigens QYMF]
MKPLLIIGRFLEDSVYEIDEIASKEFDKSFPPKDKLNGLPTQKRFIQLINMRKTR